VQPSPPTRETKMPSEQVEQEVRELLADVYKPEGIEIWLNGRNRKLNAERPIDLINRGEGERVLTLARQLAETSYA